MRIGELILNVSHCTEGVYLRWWYNGWHYFNFQNGYDNGMQTENMDIQVTKMFSRISKTERPTKLKAEYAYRITLEGIAAPDVLGFTGLLLAEKVEQYEDLLWREVEITRGDHLIKDENANGYILDFEITRKELPNTPAVYQKSVLLYLGDTLCDLDDDEIVPINKQVNDIAEMQDRQSDFTAQFKIRKTRAMQELFELAGEVGINTTFPYENQSCRLIQQGIEMITDGRMILERKDDQYYYVSILSGNQNFFKSIEMLKITDLTLATADHTWNLVDMEDSQDNDRDFLYPLCDPSDDSGCGLRAANQIDMYGGWIWPFVKVKAIWDEIFTNAGYWDTGNILTDAKFLKLFMPITSLKINSDYSGGYLYSCFRRGYMPIGATSIFGAGGTGMNTLIVGDYTFATGHYIAPFTATYKIVVTATFLTATPTVSLYVGGAWNKDFTLTWSDATHGTWETTYAGIAGQNLSVWGTANTYYSVTIAIVEIEDVTIAFGSPFVVHQFLPELSQTNFIKMICNMFGLIPDVSTRDHKIHFWNYNELYDNIPIARDWSAYLSEKEDEAEFKFGDYAQNNYLNYKESEDVIKDNGRGNMQVEDETLSMEKDVLELPVSTCDEVTVMTNVDVSRIAFNKWDEKTSLYAQQKTIDARIVFTKLAAITKTFRVWDIVLMNINSFDATSPKIACSMEVSFSDLVINYQGLSRMLTLTNLRRAKFNLPVYEVAGLKHYIPIYLSQYKAYFYVNKVNNYVPGKLCTIDLIKL